MFSATKVVRYCVNAGLFCALMFAPFTQARTQTPKGSDDASGLSERPLSKLVNSQPQDTDEYELGAGDEISVLVSDRTELSGTQVIGPDGRISVPMIGSVKLGGLTREAAVEAIQGPLSKLYTNIFVDVQVTKYGSNKVLLMGDIEHPGMQYFDGPPMLLEAISRGGSLLGMDHLPSGMPRSVIIYRGQDTVGTVDLKDVLSAGDIRLHRDDRIYVPGDQTRLISVFGEVTKPGPVVLRSDSTLASLLSDAGGITPQAGNPMIQIYDPAKQTTQKIAFKDILKPGVRDITLKAGDIIEVPRSGLATVGFFLQQIAPGVQMATIGVLAAGR